MAIRKSLATRAHAQIRYTYQRTNDLLQQLVDLKQQ